jgi:hypothetical protein
MNTLGTAQGVLSKCKSTGTGNCGKTRGIERANGPFFVLMSLIVMVYYLATGLWA